MSAQTIHIFVSPTGEQIKVPEWQLTNGYNPTSEGFQEAGADVYQQAGIPAPSPWHPAIPQTPPPIQQGNGDGQTGGSGAGGDGNAGVTPDPSTPPAPPPSPAPFSASNPDFSTQRPGEGGFDNNGVWHPGAGQHPAPTPPPAPPPAPGGPTGGRTPSEADALYQQLFGLDPLARTTAAQLGARPTNSGTFDPAIQSQMYQRLNELSTQIGNNYSTAAAGVAPMHAASIDTNALPALQAQRIDTSGQPGFDAAQIDTSQLMRPQAAQTDQSEALKFLLSGQGFDPATLARMRASSGDAIAGEQRSAAGSARLNAEQAGLGGSGAGIAMADQVNRRAGDARIASENQLQIQNAQQGIQNLTTGAGLDLSRAQTNAGAQNAMSSQKMQQLLAALQQNTGNQQQAAATRFGAGQAVATNDAASANAMALARASQMLSAMTTNAGNLQQANATNFGAQNERANTVAGQQSSTMAQGVQHMQDSILGNAQSAAQQNAGNAVNWGLGQANLTQGANDTNAGLQQQQWQTGVNGVLSLAGLSPTPVAGGLLGGVVPTSTAGAVATGAGNALNP